MVSCARSKYISEVFVSRFEFNPETVSPVNPVVVVVVAAAVFLRSVREPKNRPDSMKDE